jgi:hypothetical protein
MKKLFTAVALAAAATFASAAPVEIIRIDPGSPGTMTLNGFEHSTGVPSMTLFANGVATSAGVGGIKTTFTEPDEVFPGDPPTIFPGLSFDFIAYCIELFTRATPFGTSSTAFERFAASAPLLSQLFGYNDSLNTPDGSLAFGASATTDNATRSAGMQLAIWELLYEATDSYSLNVVGGGTFFAQGNAAAVEWGNTLLAGFTSYSGPFSALTVFSDVNNGKGFQDFITATPGAGGGQIPEPGTLALAGLGLLAAGTLRRKTKA